MRALWLVEDYAVSRFNNFARGDYNKGAKFQNVCLSSFFNAFEELIIAIKRKFNFEEHNRCSVNIVEYAARLRLGDYSTKFTSPSANNCSLIKSSEICILDDWSIFNTKYGSNPN